MGKQVKIFSGHNEHQVETAVNEWIALNDDKPIKLHLSSNDMGIAVMIEYGDHIQEIEPQREMEPRTYHLTR